MTDPPHLQDLEGMRVLVISLCLLASGAHAGLFPWAKPKESRAEGGGGLLGGLVHGIFGIGGKILGENSRGGGSNEVVSRNEASEEGYEWTPPGDAGQSEGRYDRISEPEDREDPTTEQPPTKPQKPNISNQDESNLAKTNAAKVLENNSGNYNKTKARKAKVTSSQSIRILIPGRKSGDSGSYSKNTAAVGQSSSKHKSEASSGSVGVQRDGRLDTASVGREREVGVDAAQKAQVTSDSSGFSEILLTQKSVAQKRTKETEARTSGDAVGTGVAVHAAASSSRAVTSGRAQFSDLAHESYTRI